MADDALVFHLSQQRADERRLARAVRADERGQLAAMDVQIDIPQQHLIPRRHAQVIHLNAAQLARRNARAMDMRMIRMVVGLLYLLAHWANASVKTFAFSRMMFS